MEGSHPAFWKHIGSKDAPALDHTEAAGKKLLQRRQNGPFDSKSVGDSKGDHVALLHATDIDGGEFVQFVSLQAYPCDVLFNMVHLPGLCYT